MKWNGRCQKCKYDLRGSTTSDCPECGTSKALQFRFCYVRPYFGMSALLCLIITSLFIPWPTVWATSLYCIGIDVRVHKEHNLGNGLIVQELYYFFDWGEATAPFTPGIHVSRHGNVLHEEMFMTSAQEVFFQDMNGNGSIDCHFYNGHGGNGGYSSSHIYDPLIEETVNLPTGYFKDVNDDGAMEFLARENSIIGDWDVSYSRMPYVDVVHSWNGKDDWELDPELNKIAWKATPPTEALVSTINDCIEQRSYGQAYGCFLDTFTNLCYRGEVDEAIQLLERINYEEKLAFVMMFQNTLLENARHKELLRSYGVFEMHELLNDYE